jgi:hypothetical protein
MKPRYNAIFASSFSLSLPHDQQSYRLLRSLPQTYQTGDLLASGLEQEGFPGIYGRDIEVVVATYHDRPVSMSRLSVLLSYTCLGKLKPDYLRARIRDRETPVDPKSVIAEARDDVNYRMAYWLFRLTGREHKTELHKSRLSSIFQFARSRLLAISCFRLCTICPLVAFVARHRRLMNF